MNKPCKLSNHQGLDNWCERHGMWHNGPNLAYSQGEDEISVRHREWWDGQIDPEGVKYQKPRITRLATVWKYLKALLGHTWNGWGYASWPVVWKRRRECNACPQRDPKTDSCRSCGCSLHGTILGDKLRWKSSQCPLGKW